MKRSQRVLIALAAMLTLAIGLNTPSAIAQEEFPSKPINLLVGYAAGGSSDIQARKIADLMSQDLGQRVLVENKPGMSAAVMLNYLIRQKPDGYTIGLAPVGALIGNPFMLKVEYSHRDLTYISAFGRLMQGVAVRSDSPWKTFDEFIAHAKKNPGRIRYSSYAPNSTTHWLMRLLAKDQGIDWTHVPYNSDGPAVQAVLGNHVEAIAGASGMVPFATSGQLRMLAVFNRDRLPQLPNVPSLRELGYNIPNLTQMTSLTGLLAPKGLTGTPLKRLQAASHKAYRDPGFQKLMNDMSAPIDILDSKSYEAEVAESFKVAEKLFPGLVETKN